ncbi:MAG: hypothetical protein A2521_12490 [Deltaproteobacteria bacterium RIFOXYD12_FULL_57_12]|nr:MAG: hypothetical protein A2521_12490 [Deltaproteobacteria bacterium RIFOXYD12_FULL_57_12]
MRHSLFVLLSCLFLLMTGPSGAAAADDLVLKKVDYEKVQDTIEKIHLTLSQPSSPKIFGIEGEAPRVVCDFLNTKLGEGVKSQMEIKGGMIQLIRLGVHGTPSPMLRVVLDLTPGPDYDIQQTFSQQDMRYTITVQILEKKTKDDTTASGKAKSD